MSAVQPAPAAAHQRLLRAQPERDAVLDRAPAELRLEFLEPVELAFTRLTLTGPHGAVALPAGLRLDGSLGNILVATLPHHLPPGSYTVEWATASRDGHPVRGAYGFVITGAGGPADPAAAPDSLTVPGEHAAAVPAPGRAGPPPEHHVAAGAATFGAESAGYVLVRWLTFAGLLGVIGAVSFAAGVLAILRRRSAEVASAVGAVARRRAATLGLAFAGVLAVAVLGRLYAQSLAMHGAEHVLDSARLGTMLRQTVWGWGWLLQAMATALAIIGLALARRPTRAGWWLAGAAVVLLALTPALSGHAAAMRGAAAAVAIAADTVHVLAAGVWLGGLLLLVGAGIPAAYELGPGGRAPAVAALVRAFSPLALLCAGLLVATGVAAAFIHSASLEALVGSAYGGVLVVKLGLFAVVLAAGAYNFRRVQPALGDDAGTSRLRRAATLELAAAAAVLLATSVLVATARPFPPTSDEAGPPPAMSP